MSIRAEGEMETKRAATPSEMVEALNDLLQLDHDAVGAYEIAIERLENREWASHIAAFRTDHQRHIRDLNELIISLGGTPTNEPHATAPLKEAVQQIAAKGGDEALLAAWRANELRVSTKYESYAHRAVGWPAAVKRVIDWNALDEERHYQWVVGVLGDPDPPEVAAATRAREEKERAKVMLKDAKARAGEAADQAKSRAADGLAAAARRLDHFAAEHQGDEGLPGKAADGARQVGARLESAAERLRQPGGGSDGGLADRLAAEVRANPWRTLAVTFGVAFVLGRIIR